MTTPRSYRQRSEPLPMRRESVTSHWLTRTLQHRYPDVVVEEMKVIGVHAGHTTKLRLQLNLNQAGIQAGIPAQVCLKSNWSGDPMSSSICALEARFYRYARDEIAVPAPQCYYADWDEGAAEQGLIVMEDLGGAGVFGQSTAPLTIDQAAQSLEGLAALHAGWWNSPKLQQHKWLEQSMFAVADVDQYRILAPYIRLNLEKPAYQAVLPKWLLDDPERLGRAFDRLVRSERDRAGPLCLVHGDAHLGNSYLRADGGRIWFDWQLIRKGRPWRDVTYFLIGSLRIEDRRKAERGLLRHYRESLRARGVADLMSPDEIWSEYRRWPVYGMVSWLSNQDAWGQIGLPSVERFYAAAADLDTLTVVEG
jgi:aminoglycoside phosphotransferase (APT) family kinase protein